MVAAMLGALEVRVEPDVWTVLTAVGSLGAMVGVIVALIALRSASRSADAAEKALHAATESVNEATRSRIDAQGGRPLITMGSMEGPLLLAFRDSLPAAGEQRMWEMGNVGGSELLTEASEPRSWDETTGGLLYFRCNAVIKNEGMSALWIEVHGEGRLTPDRVHGDISMANIRGTPVRVDSPAGPQWVLDAGCEASLEFVVGKRTGEWVAAYNAAGDDSLQRTTTCVMARDPRGAFADHIYLSSAGIPVRPAGAPSTWRVADRIRIGVEQPIRRTYVGLGERPDPRP